MNLTSKRMLQFLAVGALAFSATATEYVADNFESTGLYLANASNNMPIAEYKGTFADTGELTNSVWQVESVDDASKLVTEVQNYVGIRPMAGSDTNLVLNLETNGKTLTRTNNAEPDFTSMPVYVDTLIKFTPSEDDPIIADGSGVKAAVFVNAQSNLVVYSSDQHSLKTNRVTDVSIIPDQWYRLTLKLGKDTGNNAAVQVYLNGSIVTNAAAELDTDGKHSWFVSADDVGTTFRAVAFQGTGMVDEFVVTETEPNFGVPPAVWLTLMFPANVDVLTNGVAATASPVSVLSGTSVDIYAKPWYAITSGGALLGGSLVSNVFDSTTYVTSIVDGTVTSSVVATNEITAAQYDASTGLPSGYSNADMGKLITWANAKGVTPASLTDDMLDEYLLNANVGTNPELYIDSVAFDGSDATIVIKATGGDLTGRNGILNVWTTTDLATSFSAIGTFSITGDESGSITVTVPGVPAGNFIKATVDNVDLVP